MTAQEPSEVSPSGRSGPRRSFLAVARSGLAVMAFGLLLDVVEHGTGVQPGDPIVAGFPIAEHAAHLVVLLGMVLVLAGIVRDGVRAAGRMDRPAPVGRPSRPRTTGRDRRPERSVPNALR